MTIIHSPHLDAPEKTALTLGFLPLMDCAPLVIAKEKGFFNDVGLDVQLSREGSWASIRDKVLLGLLDGAQMLAGIPLASTLGLGSPQVNMITAFSIGLNGNAITLSSDLLAEIDELGNQPNDTSAAGLKQLINLRRATGRDKITLATVYPYSAHNYLLRFWLNDAGIDPDNDVILTVVPPPQMAVTMKKGHIDGYCVGEPWNSVAQEMDIGNPIISGYQIWNNCPDKVFAVTESWNNAYPATHQALVCALIQASHWLDMPQNSEEALQILLGSAYLGPALSMLSQPQLKQGNRIFHRYAASYPWRSHALWFLEQMQKWGQLKQDIDLTKTACKVYRPDIYRGVAKEMKILHPTIDCKPEGYHNSEWILQGNAGAVTMGSDLFFNGITFDPNSCR